MISSADLLRRYDIAHRNLCNQFKILEKLDQEQTPSYISYDIYKLQIHMLYANLVDCFEEEEDNRNYIREMLCNGKRPTSLMYPNCLEERKPIELLPHIIENFPHHIIKFDGFVGRTQKRHIQKIQELIDVFNLYYYEAEAVVERYSSLHYQAILEYGRLQDEYDKAVTDFVDGYQYEYIKT